MTNSGFKLRKKNKPDITYGAKLRDAVEYHEDKNWRTPTTEGEAGRRGLGKATCKELRAKNRTITLTRQVRDTENKNWSTPTLAESSGGKRTKQIKEGKWHNIQLREAIDLEKEKNWPTPTSTERSGTNPKTGKGGGLSKQAKEQSWPTPEVHTVEKYSLQKDGQKKTQRSKNLVAMAIKGELGLPDQEKSSTSGKSQESPGKLNPNWVEQLMGLPLGWTQLPIEWTD